MNVIDADMLVKDLTVMKKFSPTVEIDSLIAFIQREQTEAQNRVADNADDFWGAILETLKKTVPPSVFPLLSNKLITCAKLQGRCLVLYVLEESARAAINRPAIIEAVQEAASKHFGGIILQVEVRPPKRVYGKEAELIAMILTSGGKNR